MQRYCCLPRVSRAIWQFPWIAAVFTDIVRVSRINYRLYKCLSAWLSRDAITSEFTTPRGIVELLMDPSCDRSRRAGRLILKGALCDTVLNPR